MNSKDILVIVGMGLCFSPLFFDYLPIITNSNWTYAVGRVTSVEKGYTPSYYMPINPGDEVPLQDYGGRHSQYKIRIKYDYYTAGGETRSDKVVYNLTSQLFSNMSVLKDQSITVKYNPANPAQSFSPDLVEKFTQSQVGNSGMLAGLVFLVGSMAMLGSKKKHNKVTISYREQL